MAIRRTTSTRRGKRRGPGIVKTRGQPLISRRLVEFVRSSDYRWRELFESADVISEGATRGEEDGAVYYGSTSILLLRRSRGGSLDDDQLDEVSTIIGSDPHARIRAVRIACLEAQLRSGGPIGRVRAELFVRRAPEGIRVDVDVEARVFEEGQAEEEGASRLPGANRTRTARNHKP